MKIGNIILLLVGIAVGAMVWCCVLKLPPCSRAEPIVEDADAAWKPVSGLNPMLIKPKAIPRPLVEYPDAGSSYLLIEPPSQLQRKASKVLSRPVIEYSDSAFSLALEEPQTSPVVLPRPVVEYSDSAITLALESPSQELIFSAAQADPRPLVENADAGWSEGLSPPIGLWEERE
jgi:hypothetical protein